MPENRITGTPEFNRALDWEIQRKMAAVAALAQVHSALGEAHMKTTALWTDQSGMARKGLKARVDLKPGQYVVIILSHSVEYGVYLELSNSGRFSILRPTALRLSKEFFDDVEKVLK